MDLKGSHSCYNDKKVEEKEQISAVILQMKHTNKKVSGLKCYTIYNLYYSLRVQQGRPPSITVPPPAPARPQYVPPPPPASASNPLLRSRESRPRSPPIRSSGIVPLPRPRPCPRPRPVSLLEQSSALLRSLAPRDCCRSKAVAPCPSPHRLPPSTSASTPQRVARRITVAPSSRDSRLAQRCARSRLGGMWWPPMSLQADGGGAVTETPASSPPSGAPPSLASSSVAHPTRPIVAITTASRRCLSPLLDSGPERPSLCSFRSFQQRLGPVKNLILLSL
jgi:hypothetical protein